MSRVEELFYEIAASVLLVTLFIALIPVIIWGVCVISIISVLVLLGMCKDKLAELKEE